MFIMESSVSMPHRKEGITGNTIALTISANKKIPYCDRRAHQQIPLISQFLVVVRCSTSSGNSIL